MSEAVRVRALGVISLLLFFVPLVAPLVQAATLAYALWKAWQGALDRTSLVVAAIGSAAGFLLFLATEYIWIV
jgi:hypothetical protein